MTKYRITPDASGEVPPPGAMKPLTHLIGQAPGNVIALIQDGKVVDSAYFVDGEAEAGVEGRGCEDRRIVLDWKPNRAQSSCRSWVTTGWWAGPATATSCS